MHVAEFDTPDPGAVERVDQLRLVD